MKRMYPALSTSSYQREQERKEAAIAARKAALAAQKPQTVNYQSMGRVTPTGTTEGQRIRNGRCAICDQPADWNPGAGRALCHRHWDSY